MAAGPAMSATLSRKRRAARLELIKRRYNELILRSRLGLPDEIDDIFLEEDELDDLTE